MVDNGFEFGVRMDTEADFASHYITVCSSVERLHRKMERVSDTVHEIVEGFELGGNDYLKKPFKMLELIVRIKALLRRNVRDEDNIFEIGDYTLDLSTQLLSHKYNGSIELSLIEAKLLKELIVNVGHTVDASSMMQLIWQRDDPYSRNSLHGFIHKLRNYLRYDPSISLINQRGIGYMLTAKRE